MISRPFFRPAGSDPPAEDVSQITFVPFLRDGRCVLIGGPDGPDLPSGHVQDGEDYRLDTVLRVPLETAGFRYQRFRPFGLAGSHLYAWIEGARYRGSRPYAAVPLTETTAEEAAAALDSAGRPALAAAVLAAAASWRAQDDESYYADNLRTLQLGYLRGRTPQQGSGFGGDHVEWRQARRHISEGVSRSGSFLDVGCANGLLMESMAAWCAERGLVLEPYGIDFAPELADLARRRLPQWADRIWQGNAIDWEHPDGMRFDFVHILLDCVPVARHGDLVRHHLARTVRPGGRLLVSDYGADPGQGVPSAADGISALGFPVAGQSSGGQRPGRPPTPTAWLDG